VWSRESPPLPADTAVKCSPSSSSLFGNPYFSNASKGVVPAITISDSTAKVAFDVTSDGGLDWTPRSERSVPVVANGQLGFGLGYPLTSIKASAWWLVGWNSSGVTTQISRNAGRSWTQVKSSGPRGVPTGIVTWNSREAVLTIRDREGRSSLFETRDGGLDWPAFSPKAG
jgi:photosystem II stability/assembly factor-like uncharacterized protein